MVGRDDRSEAAEHSVPPYAGDQELSLRLRACDATMSVDDVRRATEAFVTGPEGVKNYLRQLLCSVRETDEAKVAALIECALGLWNELVQSRIGGLTKG